MSIVNMIVNTVLRKLVSRGVDEGIKYMSQGGKRRGQVPNQVPGQVPGQDQLKGTGARVEPASGADAAQRRAGQDLAKRARDIAKLSRRLR